MKNSIKKIILLFVLFFSFLFFFWCENKKNVQNEKNWLTFNKKEIIKENINNWKSMLNKKEVKENINENLLSKNYTWQSYWMTWNNDIKLKTPILLISDINEMKLSKNDVYKKIEKYYNLFSWKKDKIVIYIDKNCKNEPICSKNVMINFLLNSLNLSWDLIEFKEISWNYDIYIPLVVINKDFKYINFSWNKIIEEYFKKYWNNYYSVLWVWINWKENLCNDWKDNDNDWKIDAQDTEDCNKYFWYLYNPNEFTQQELSVIKQQIKFFKNALYWFIVEEIDYNSEKWKKLINLIKEWIKNNQLTWNKNEIVIINWDKYNYAIINK